MVSAAFLRAVAMWPGNQPMVTRENLYRNPRQLNSVGSSRARRTRRAGRTASLRTMPEFLAGTASVVGSAASASAASASAAPGLTAGLVTSLTRVLALTLSLAKRPLAIAGGKHDFKFVQLIPLLIGTLAIRDGKQFLHTAARVRWLAGLARLIGRLCFVHRLIISLSAGVFPGSYNWRRRYESTRYPGNRQNLIRAPDPIIRAYLESAPEAFTADWIFGQSTFTVLRNCSMELLAGSMPIFEIAPDT
jgi:hypothetical protein